jgi:hypothetical protein
MRQGQRNIPFMRGYIVKCPMAKLPEFVNAGENSIPVHGFIELVAKLHEGAYSSSTTTAYPFPFLVSCHRLFDNIR